MNRISSHIAEKIKQTALDLNYLPNKIARGLKTNKTFTIGLIVADISNAFSSTIARIIENEAEKFNYTVIFGSSDENTERSKKLMEVLINHQVDGLIITPTEHSEKQVQYLMENEIPFVLIDRFYKSIACDHISIDNFNAGKKLAGHLIENGCKRIGFITYLSANNNIADRKAGYLAALEGYNLPSDAALIKEIGSPIEPAEIISALQDLLNLKQGIDGIIFSANMLSTHGLKYLMTLDIEIPGDLAIATFDQSDAVDLFYAPLTYIKQPLELMGRVAVETLMASIENKNELVQIQLPGELITRNSYAKG